jgi:hypothetical protein
MKKRNPAFVPSARVRIGTGPARIKTKQSDDWIGNGFRNENQSIVAIAVG